MSKKSDAPFNNQEEIAVRRRQLQKTIRRQERRLSQDIDAYQDEIEFGQFPAVPQERAVVGHLQGDGRLLPYHYGLQSWHQSRTLAFEKKEEKQKREE